MIRAKICFCDFVCGDFFNFFCRDFFGEVLCVLKNVFRLWNDRSVLEHVDGKR